MEELVWMQWQHSEGELGKEGVWSMVKQKGTGLCSAVNKTGAGLRQRKTVCVAHDWEIQIVCKQRVSIF